MWCISAAEFGPLKVSGFLHFEDLDLALILIENGLVAVDSEAETSTTLPVWSTQKDECDALFTLSLQADGNLEISSD